MSPGCLTYSNARYLDALHYSIDGNFHFNLKVKQTDPNDFPLTQAAAYFVHETDRKKFLGKAPPPKHEVREDPTLCMQLTSILHFYR